jgi:hypothetical protein
MADSELDRLDPELTTVPLSTGYEVGLQRLKTRQFFRLLKVLTRGLGPAMVQSGLDFNQDSEGFGQKLLAMTLMAIPEAEQQFIEFMVSMCTPLGMHEAGGRSKRLSKDQQDENQEKVTELLDELNNPELDDLLDLAEAIIKQEAPEIQALGKRVAGLLEMFKKTGQMNEETKTAEESSSPEPSPQPSIFSAMSTDGPTSTSSSSRSAGSGSASRRRQPAASAST